MLHAAGPGCGIYDKRPHSCRVWRCGWIENDDWEDDLRPDRCGFIVDEVLDLVIANDTERVAAQIWALPGHEEDWREQPAIAVILALLHHHPGVAVLWRIPGRRARGFMLGEDGKIMVSDAARDDGTHLGSADDRVRRARQLYTETQK